jgi:thiosulfate dehydrogenase
LYDKFWAVAGVAEPTDDQPLWASRPDIESNTRSGADTWRCKECHGWDYKGVDGAYSSGSHRTGIVGIFGTTLSAQEVFDLIKTDHSYGQAGLSGDDIWDLAKFVLEGQVDTDAILDGAAFNGSANAGRLIFDSTCAVCHGADGLTPPPGHPEFDEYPGLLAEENPWEFQHKVRFGQPGTAMPAQFDILTTGQVADLGSYVQTLPTSAAPEGFSNASVNRGGALYDKFWAVAGLDAPADDHPLWASRPDTESNTRTGADTWRCKECHGWDYKGVDGAYSSGSHRTGIDGIFGTMIAAEEAFDLIKTDHSYGQAGLSDDDIWDLAKFVLEGQIDTDTIIDAGGAFTGAVNAGQTLYDSGIGTNVACMICHGADGLLAPPGADPATYDDFVGLIANENPWEFQHKVRFGQPGTTMPSSVAGGGTTQDVADLGAFSQTLPEAP